MPFTGPPPPAGPPPTNTLAIAALICGTIGLAVLVLVIVIVASLWFRDPG
jgi:hypothetical protein